MSNRRDKIFHLLNIKFSRFPSLFMYKIRHRVEFPHKVAPNLPKNALDHNILPLRGLQQIKLLNIVLERPFYSFLFSFLSVYWSFLNGLRACKKLVFSPFFKDSFLFSNQILGIFLGFNAHITLCNWTINLLKRCYCRWCFPLPNDSFGCISGFQFQ